MFSVFGAVLANQAGWVAAEVGRQPWIVHPPVPYDDAGELVLAEDGRVDYDESLGLRTSEAVSEAVSAEQVLGSIVMFTLIYALLFMLWVVVLNDKIQTGPERIGEGPRKDEGGYLDSAARRTAHLESLTERSQPDPDAQEAEG